MSRSLLAAQLHDEGLHTESVDRLLDHYEQLHAAIRREQYGEVGYHTGHICENISNILRVEAGLEPDEHPEVGDFVNRISSGQFGDSFPYELRIMLPHAMRSAFDFRNRRDAVHVNLETTVNQSDMLVAERLGSWMIAELVRVFGDDSDIDRIHELLEELATPVSGGPLDELITDIEAENQQILGETLEGLAKLDDTNGHMSWTSKFHALTVEQRVITTLLRQRAAAYLGILSDVEIGLQLEELAEIVDTSAGTVRNYLGHGLISKLEQQDGYHIAEPDIQQAAQTVRDVRS